MAEAAKTDIEKAQKDVQRAQDAQPTKAAIGAVVGGIAAESVAIGSLYVKFISELSRNANRMGRSVLEMQNPRIGEEIAAATLSNPKSLAALQPFMLLVAAAPFAGAAMGAWFNTRRGEKAVTQKQALVDKARDDQWQARLAAESKTAAPDEKSR